MSELLRECVSAEVIERAEDYARRFGGARPFRHVCIDGFFRPGLLGELVASFPPFDEQLAINENGVVGDKAVHEKITELGPAWQRLDRLVSGEEFRTLISTITGIPELQYDPHYFGGGTHENRHGQSLDAHVDFNYHPLTRQHRRLNLIVYLSEEWRTEWGGAIQLHRDPYRPPSEDEIVTITPALNRCVLFETNEISWHGFPRIDLPEDKRHLTRKSFALYYYTDQRPPEETGPEHSTIYVEEHLPEDWQPGMVLDAEQLQHLRNLLTRRDQHLRRLYGNIKQLNTELNGLRESLAAGLDVEREVAPAPDAGGLPDTAALEAELRRRELAIARLRARVRDLEGSTSWRITRPLRGLKRLLGGG